MRAWPIILVVATVAGSAISADAVAQPRNLEGSYVLVRRDLPDGTTLRSPDIVGMMTFTEGYRNFNLRVENTDGQPGVISYLARYRIRDGAYCEQPMHWFDHGVLGEGSRFDAPAEKSECAPIVAEDDAYRFALPGEPVVVRFRGDGFTATAEGQFVDHWRRLD